MLPDIQNRSDINTLVAAFYQHALTDELIGHFFTKIKPIDLVVHIPKIADFWESMLLRKPVYEGSPMQIHMHLNQLSPLKPKHFERWLQIWNATVHQHFSGPFALLAVERAAMVARSISMRIEDDRLYQATLS
jgi:hemoglobin